MKNAINTLQTLVKELKRISFIRKLYIYYFDKLYI